MRTGVRVDGQEAAIEVFASWLETWGASWWITLPQLSADAPPQPPPLRPSWCYGTLGIARALQLAGLAAGNDHRRQAAEDAALARWATPRGSPGSPTRPCATAGPASSPPLGPSQPTAPPRNGSQRPCTWPATASPPRSQP